MTEPDTTPPPPGTEVERAPDLGRGALVGTSLDSRLRYARALADAGDLLPKAYRDAGPNGKPNAGPINPGRVLLAVETGTMLGVHPIAAINGINVIEGKPTISPALMTALVRRAGHKVRVRVTGTVEAGDVAATCTVIRADDPDAPFTATWTLHRAARAGLCNVLEERGRTIVRARSASDKVLPWEAYTEAMLKARAIGEACRDAAEDALAGVHYTPEELGASVDADGHVVVDGEVVEQQVAPATAPASAPTVDPDAVRAAILGATSRRNLVECLATLDLAAIVDGRPRFRKDALEAVELGDADGQPCTAWALVGKVGPTLPETDEDGPQGGATPPQGPDAPPSPPEAASAAPGPRPGTSDRGPRAGEPDPWTTPTVQGDPSTLPIVDAEVVPDTCTAEAACPAGPLGPDHFADCPSYREPVDEADLDPTDRGIPAAPPPSDDPAKRGADAARANLRGRTAATTGEDTRP